MLSEAVILGSKSHFVELISQLVGVVVTTFD